MINEVEALLGVLIVIVLNYLFLWKRSKIIGGFALLLTTFGMLVIYRNTDYELIAWLGIIVTLTAWFTEFALAKMGHTINKNRG